MILLVFVVRPRVFFGLRVLVRIWHRHLIRQNIRVRLLDGRLRIPRRGRRGYRRLIRLWRMLHRHILPEMSRHARHRHGNDQHDARRACGFSGFSSQRPIARRRIFRPRCPGVKPGRLPFVPLPVRLSAASVSPIPDQCAAGRRASGSPPPAVRGRGGERWKAPVSARQRPCRRGR